MSHTEPISFLFFVFLQLLEASPVALFSGNHLQLGHQHLRCFCVAGCAATLGGDAGGCGPRRKGLLPASTQLSICPPAISIPFHSFCIHFPSNYCISFNSLIYNLSLQVQLQPYVPAFNAAITCCGTAQHWERASLLLQKMKETRAQARLEC